MASAGVSQLWDAPYHRLGLMHPNASSAGWGHSDSREPRRVGDITYDFGIRSVDFVRSPANGQTGIPTSWSGNESPSPLPAGVRGPVGYPIMVVYSGGQNVTMRAAEIIAPNGSRVPFYLRRRSSSSTTTRSSFLSSLWPRARRYHVASTST